MDRVRIYIDASNLYKGAKNVCGCGRVTIPNFCRFLANGRPLKAVKYFCVDPPEPSRTHCNVQTTEGREKYRAAAIAYTKQLAFMNNLAQWNRIVLIKGRLQRDQKTGDFKEKGVDVALALHLLIDCARDDFETAIVVTGDSDVILAIKTGISWGKKIEAAAFQPCYHIKETCQQFKFTELTPEILNPFLRFP